MWNYYSLLFDLKDSIINNNNNNKTYNLFSDYINFYQENELLKIIFNYCYFLCIYIFRLV